MEYIADLHVHSPFSRATSPECSPAGLAAWARLKGIQVVATGDLTHPGWLARLKQELVPAEPGLYRLRDTAAGALPVPGAPVSDAPVRFMLSAEISSIYKRHGKTRKVHNLLYLPDFFAAERLNARLAAIGNIESDGRPILGLDSRNLLEILLEVAPDAFLVPAHIWTPWFSLFGSKSGFDSIEECFGDLSDQIFALETGLSSDPAMNRLISGLDRYALISNSDCHSPSKLGREANLFSTGLDFYSLRDALKSNRREQFVGTIEFFPEEGKYHFDGHRDCKVCLDPHETRKLADICPVCGKPLTVGVHHRVLELADRETPCFADDAPRFHSLIPLPEILGELLRVGPQSRAVQSLYGRTLARFGSEFNLLLYAGSAEIADFDPVLALAIERMRSGQVVRTPGYDGEFGVIRVFEEGELERLAGQSALFAGTTAKKGRPQRSATPAALPPRSEVGVQPEPAPPAGPNQQQQTAIQAGGRRILVAAGPGTGKTFTLVSRLLREIEHGADPAAMVVITFTNRAADELRERLHARCGEQAEQLFVGTFHRFCLERLRLLQPDLTVVGVEERERLLRRLFPRQSAAERAEITSELAAHFLGIGKEVSDRLQRYIDELVHINAIDLDAIIPVLVKLLQADDAFRRQVADAVRYLYIDEFQDLNRSQYDLVTLLGESAEIFAIGDPDQAIYGFRGSDLRYFFRFAEIPGTTVLSLRTSYRLAPQIVQAATALISRNLIRSGLPLESGVTDRGGRLEQHRVITPSAEAELVARRIEELMGGFENLSRATGRAGGDDGRQIGFGDIAVLFRLGRQAEELAEVLARRGIPFQLIGATPYYLTASLRPLYFLLQVTAGSDSMADWLELLAAFKGVGEGILAKLDAELPVKGDLRSELAARRLTPALARIADELTACLDEFVSQSEQSGVDQALLGAMHRFGIAPDGEDAARLLRTAAAFGTGLQALSSHLCRYAAATVYDERAEAVALMTCHSAKGLEFPVVFVVGLEEGILPCTLMGRPDVEEERRLLYVALTRAKERVILSSAARRPWGGAVSGELSRFMAELPAELIETPAPVQRRRRTAVDATAQLDLF